MGGETSALLVIGWGNESRGDDALGPRCVAALQAALPAQLRPQVEFLEDYQLQVECALDLVGRKHVLFIDASTECAAPFEAHPIHARQDHSFTSHSLSPQALLQVYANLTNEAPPPATLLAIRGLSFGLGEPMTAQAQRNLDEAIAWGAAWIREQAN